MSSTSPQVSVVMRSCNSAAFIACAMRSVLNQTESDLELVVVDGASADSTPEIVSELARVDARVRLHRESQREGVGPALNRGVALARSDLIAIMDADDIAVPTRLERQVAFLHQHVEVGAVGGALQVIDQAGRSVRRVVYPTGSADLKRMAEHSSPLATPSVMFRKALFEMVGGCRPIFVTCEDYDLWLRFAERTRLANLAEVLVKYRIHPAQESLANIELQMLLTSSARGSAAERRAGRADPLDDPMLTLDELRRRRRPASFDPHELPRALAARANFLSHVGLPQAALQVLGMAAQVPAGGTVRAELEIAYARAYFGTHNLTRAAHAVLQAVRADAPTVARTGARALSKR